MVVQCILRPAGFISSTLATEVEEVVVVVVVVVVAVAAAVAVVAVVSLMIEILHDFIHQNVQTP